MNPRYQNPTALTARVSRMLIVLLLVTLVVTLVNRFPSATRNVHTAMRAGISSPVWQHLDRDALHWAKPIFVFTALQPDTFYPLVCPAGRPVAVLLLDESLYNRPPPCC